ncbi:nuclear transport factor 2 family protein [Puniceibacterium sp. IMCC21224]|uniref:nuclear transport factor 2 family protein n=1 Tax=Puniceibacterium sp. IMCC21224 TaxID=1618204 RepID=UPI00065D3809|nr:nuclear transport factor 2 family protein [Puniceibacterium sp. IMCC21224]KMK64547.1 ketosteroid isomerase-like protein [Puniceibacterium sp. IMCC21224]
MEEKILNNSFAQTVFATTAALSLCLPALAQAEQANALDITQEFLGHIFASDMDAAAAMVAEEAVFVNTNPATNPSNPMHGTYTGPEGAIAFFGAFGSTLEAGAFNVSGTFGDDQNAAMFGTFSHTVRATGQIFASDWALIAETEDGLITAYRFYEDSEAFAIANNAKE